MTSSAWWLTADFTGADRMRQVTRTRLLRLKVHLYLRWWRATKRRFLTGWMSR